VSSNDHSALAASFIKEWMLAADKQASTSVL
jgi:hypothetical protein